MLIANTLLASRKVTMLAFLAGAAGSAIVALIHGWFFAQREDNIRAYLSRKREGRS